MEKKDGQEPSDSQESTQQIRIKGSVEAREILQTGQIPQPEEPEPTQVMEIATGELPLHWSDPPSGEIPASLEQAHSEDVEHTEQEPDDEILKDLKPAGFRATQMEWAEQDFGETSDDLAEEKIEKRPRTRTRQKPKSDLVGRLLSGIVFAAITGACLKLGPVAVLVLIVLIIVVALSEFYSTLNKKKLATAGLIGILGSIGASLAAYSKGSNGLMLISAIVVISSMVWFLPGLSNDPKERPLAGSSFSLIGYFWIGFLGSFAALVITPHDYPNRHGVAYLTGGLLFAIASDVGAYFIGKFFKKIGFKTHNFAKKTSPSKTVEGVIGAIVLALISAAVLGKVMHPWSESNALLIGFVVALATVIGDLIESMIKRDLKIKDMGSVLPGHGGLLDRIDGILLAMPVLYYMLQILHMS
jgi:phosphatidate cytidylyltransferase